MAEELEETKQNRAQKIRLADFCDMKELEKILSDWSVTSGMSAIVRDTDQQYITGRYGFTDYCQTMLSTQQGRITCRNCEEGAELFTCHAGLCNFSLPVTLPDGQVLAYIFCGQVRIKESEKPDFYKLSEEFKLDAGKLAAEYEGIEIMRREKIEAAKALLSSSINTFVKNKYDIWKNKVEIRDDRTLSRITQILYAYNITLDLETGNYTLITGTGLERLVDIYKKNTNYITAQKEASRYVHPGHVKQLYDLVNVENLRKCADRTGYIDTMEYPVIYPDRDEYEWHEINVFASRDNDGNPIANILGRDVTEAHNLQEKNNREIKAAAAKNQILSDLTKMLYSYNITLNLNTGKYSLIEGSGMTKFMEIFKLTDDYRTAYAQKITYILPEFVEQFDSLAGPEALKRYKNNHGFIGNLEYGVKTDHGDEWHEINVFISADEFGNPIANILGRDITEAHKRQEMRDIAQKAAAARDQLLSGVTRLLYSFNVTVNLNTWNYTLILGTGCDEWQQILSASEDYVLVCNKIRKRLDEESKEKYDSLLEIPALKNFSNKTGYIGTITTSTQENGRKQWQEINLFMGTNEYGEPIANILGRDITEAREQQANREKELRAASARDQLLSGITKMLYSYNLSVNVNTGKYTLITGTGLDDIVAVMESGNDYELILEHFQKSALPEYLDRGMKLLSLDTYRDKNLQSGYIGTEEIPETNGDGKTEWHEINIFAGIDEEGNPIINLLGRDVTEAHDRADTRAQLEIAEASSKSKTQFLFNMSHDIRTPMNAIIGFTDLLEKHLDDRELAVQYIDKIKHSNEFLLSLINNVLEMARIESGKETLDESKCNVYEFNDSLEAVFASQMEAKGLHFEISSHVEHADIWGDRTKSKEIFLNLLSNALKYTPAGGSVTFETCELPSDREGYALYQTVVRDTGIGMSKEFLPHLFDEFSRERNTTESKVMGTGLGMSIVKSLVDLMQGTIEVESEPGMGTAFTVTIPHRFDIQTNAEEEEEEERGAGGTYDFNGKRILLAEDNDFNAEIAMEILKEAGFEVERAADGVICVDMLQKAPCGHYDLILMDIQMPNMDGYKATRTIREMKDPCRNTIPIIAMTANAFDEDRKNAFAAGMNGHLAKPIHIDELMKTLASLIG